MHDGTRIGYVLKRFPRLSETFVLNEILALERMGLDVEVFSLLKPPAEARHGLLSELKARVTYLPSSGNLGRVRMMEGLDALPLTLGEALGDGAPRDPLYPAKSAEDVATLQLKAAALATLAPMRGIGHFHAHFGSDATTVALLAGRLSGIGYSFTAHARDIFHTYASPEADDAMRRIKLEAARFTVTVSEYNRRRLTRIAPAAEPRIHRVYNGIDLRRFRPDASRSDPGLVVAVGRLIEKKGFTGLIDACRMMHDGGTHFRCRIIGDGPLRPVLEAQIVAAGLGGIVSIHDPLPQEQLVREMQAAQVVTLPCVVGASGDRDGLPTVLLEAMALGLPVVTTTVSGGPEIVAHGDTGLLVEPGDPVALAASLETLIGDPEASLRLGRAGRRRAEALFSLDRSAASLAALFRDALGVRQPEPEIA